MDSAARRRGSWKVGCSKVWALEGREGGERGEGGARLPTPQPRAGSVPSATTQAEHARRAAIEHTSAKWARRPSEEASAGRASDMERPGRASHGPLAMMAYPVCGDTSDPGRRERLHSPPEQTRREGRGRAGRCEDRAPTSAEVWPWSWRSMHKNHNVLALCRRLTFLPVTKAFYISERTADRRRPRAHACPTWAGS